MTTMLARGLAAGLIAGLVTGLFALLLAEPSIEAAIALEEAAEPAVAAGVEGASAPEGHAGHSHSHGDDAGLSRATQKLGLVLGMMLYGTALGSMFGVAFAWSVGRLEGDAWRRALKLGTAAIVALVLLPAMKMPPNPPAVGNPETVGSRTLVFVALWSLALLLALGAWAAARWLERRAWSASLAQTTVGAAAVALGGGALYLLPSAAGAADFPADLLWSFRLWAIATQVLLFGGVAVLYGCLAAHDERAARGVSLPLRA